jgi:8-oxo-dGTP diphosphatase
MDWNNWQPRERANLSFVVRNGRILLIRKKRGLGAGKINAPGGKVEPGETALEAAVRETREEIGVTLIAPQLRGELHFQFVDGYSLHCAVFLAGDFTGELVETDEATPLWADLDKIPYCEMWADDAHWLPLLVAGKCFRGWFHFDGEKMLKRNIEVVESLPCLAF